MKPPLLESFSLSDAQYRSAKRAPEHVIGSLFLAVFFGAEIWFVRSTGVSLHDGVGTMFGTIFGGALIAVYPLALTIPFALGIVPFAFRKISRNFRNAEAFDRAKKEFDGWLARTERNFWLKLTGLQFEREVASLFNRSGYSATLTKATGDDGVDIWINEHDGKVVVQCKAHTKPIGPSVVRELYGTLQHFHAKRALLVSRSGFTPGVAIYTKGKPIDLMSLDHLIILQRKLQNGL